jgi:hypothetical protein
MHAGTAATLTGAHAEDVGILGHQPKEHINQ